MGSRFGGLKQIIPVSPSGESIIDFSIYDALRSGYNRIVIIIRKDIEKDFHQFFGKRLAKHVDIEYAFQKSGDFVVPGRKKPLGTADAVLAAKDFIKGPFTVINADDFYGLDSFQKGSEFLRSTKNPSSHALVGYRLKNTVSEHGSVSRGECSVDESNTLKAIRELHKIYKENGSLYYQINDSTYPISEETFVSMNFWCFQEGVIQYFENGYQHFLDSLPSNPSVEFLIPDVCQSLIDSKSGTFKVVPTDSTWFGITYKEDFEKVSSGISDLIESGEYTSPLWS